MIQQKGLISVTITIICLTTIFSCPTTLGIVTDEKGEATIDNLVCTKEGDIIVIYHREYMPADVWQESGPYVRVHRVSEDDTFQTIIESDQIDYCPEFWGLIQEDNTTLRLIGWDNGELTELCWFKDNHSIEPHNLGTSFPYSHFSCAAVYFPRQHQYIQKVQNYNLIGWSNCMGEPIVIATDGSTTDLIHPQNISQEVYFQANAAFIADNSSEVYYAHFISRTYDLLIRHLSSNMTILNETRFTLSGTPSDNISCLDTLLGLNGEPYVGVRILDPNWETPLDTYQHTFELVNLKKNTSFVLSIPVKENIYDWNGLVDESGTFYGFFDSNTDDNFIRYVRVTSDGNIELDTTFTPGENGGVNIITFWGENYIIGEKNNGIFLFELSTGTVVISNTEILPFIPYYDQYKMAYVYYFIFFLYIFLIFLFVLVIIVIIRFWRRKISGVEVPEGNMKGGGGGPTS